MKRRARGKQKDVRDVPLESLSAPHDIALIHPLLSDSLLLFLLRVLNVVNLFPSRTPNLLQFNYLLLTSAIFGFQFDRFTLL